MTSGSVGQAPGSGFAEVEGAEPEEPDGYDLATQRIESP